MLAKDKMWNGCAWYGFMEEISTSTTDYTKFDEFPSLDFFKIFRKNQNDSD